jgi:hypothetical protein
MSNLGTVTDDPVIDDRDEDGDPIKRRKSVYNALIRILDDAFRGFLAPLLGSFGVWSHLANQDTQLSEPAGDGLTLSDNSHSPNADGLQVARHC